MSISNRGSGRTLRMIPGAVGHNYSEDHQSAPVLGEAARSYHRLHRGRSGQSQEDDL
jgi:hypothetical protein